ncbi:MAG: T9SS type A sorting domain-containing protein [Bacteroidia bacterium]|nr:T9SS type A sorting domain-containing protein [Bacteroidia bacterium]
MRKLIFTILTLVFFTTSIFAQKVHTISLVNSTNEFKVLKNEPLKFNFKASFTTLNTKEVLTKEGFFTQLNTDGYVNDGDNGTPSLPTLKKLIEVPYNATVKVNIISFDEEIIDLNDLGITYKVIPQQPSVRKDQDVEKLPFHYNQQIYLTNDFIENTIAEYQQVGIMRGINIGRIVIRPIQYNPSQNTLRVLKNIVVEVVFTNADLAKTESLRNKYYSPLFESSCKMLANYKTNTNKDAITTSPVKYLIISDRMFEAQLLPFIQWKTRKGFKVVTAYTDVIGTTTTAIKNYILAQYNGGSIADPAPSYILLVGDVAQVPAFTGSAIASASPTDLYYGEMDGGSDVIPDIYYGRFSAQNTSQLQPQIEKTLQYEEYTMPDPSFLQYSVLVAGVDGSMAPTYGNGQVNYAANNYNNASNGIISNTYLYGSGSPIISNSAAAAPAIHQNVSTGAGFVNYTAHCGSSGWSDPSFTTTDVAALTNMDKYCFMIGNCCQSNMFNVSECFGESILRATKKGAIGYIGASDYSYWNEDYYFSVGFKTVIANPVYDATKLGFYDKLFHTHGETEANWHVTGGQLMHAGNLAVTQGGTSVTYYWEEYHLMGDPSLMPYLGIPTTLSATYQSSVPMGVTSVAVATEPYAYVGLSLNNTWVDAKYTGASGNITLDLTTIAAPCTLDVVITKQNRQPHIGTIIIVPNSAPYVVYNAHLLHDSGVSVNGNVEYSENVNMDLTLRNVGSVNATGVNAVLSTTNTNINITDNTQTFGNINANATATQNNSFAFNVANVITDQQSAQFTVTASDGASNTWNTNFNVILNAPVMQATTVVVDDATGNNNGRLDPGESALIKILTLNNGHAVSPIANSTLTLNSGSVTIPTNNQNIGAIVASGNTMASFTVIVDAGATIGSTASFTYDVNAGGYTATKSFTLTIGLIVEDFETNTFTNYPWDLTHTGTVPWTIINSGNIYEGNYTARSGAIGNIATSELTMQITVTSADSLSFYKKVSSEQDYDWLKFYVDGVILGQWSGEDDWSRHAYMMTTGLHTISWIYSKDYSVENGLDAAWVDFVIFPPINMPLLQPETFNNLQYFNSYPNPFKSESIISFSLLKSENVYISLINTLGETVKVILPHQNMSQGNHQVQLSSEGLSSGIYFCKLKTSSENKTVKIVITK